VTYSGIVILAVRAGLVVLFLPASALDKTLNFRGAVTQASELFAARPAAGARPAAVAMIVIGLFIEITMPLAILTGTADRLAAFVLAGYCAMTAILFKRFWQPGDFWRGGDSRGRGLFWDFLKNFSLASGFLLITVGLNGTDWRRFVQHPLGSTHPYSHGETIR
jgi:putative oxidoreductase